MPQIIEASKFLSNLGVNVHLNFAGTPYQNLTAVKTAMNYLGLNTMRDMGAQQNMTAYANMANAGFKFDFFVPSDPYSLSPTSVVQQFAAFAAAHPGSIVSLEGANEVNNWPVTYNGSTSLAAEAAYQQAFYAAAKANPTLASIPVINLSLAAASVAGYSGLGDMSAAADIGNVHAYVSYGNQPNVELSRLVSYAQTVTPGKPMAITETGYPTLPSNTGQGVDEATQAKLTLNYVLDAAKMGITSTYLYELVDNQFSGGGAWNYGGLFRGDWSAKPAATALHNLTTVLTTGAGDAATAAPSYTVSGLTGYNDSLLIRESNGTYNLIVWDEPDIWNSTTHAQIQAPVQTATIKLGQTVTGYSVYDPILGSSAIASGGPTNQISVQVTDHPVIIELHTDSTAPPSAPAPAPAPEPSPTPEPSPAPDPVPTPAPGTGPLPMPGSTTSTINGTSSANRLWGGAGNDLINAGDGDDFVYAAAGDDIIFGGAGHDVLYGKTGVNTLTGGTGPDDFVFDTALSSSFHYITDFVVGQDRLFLDDAFFTGLKRGLLPSSQFNLGGAAQDTADRIIYDPTSGNLSYDADGSGALAPALIGQLQAGLSLSASDIVVF